MVLSGEKVKAPIEPPSRPSRNVRFLGASEVSGEETVRRRGLGRAWGRDGVVGSHLCFNIVRNESVTGNIHQDILFKLYNVLPFRHVHTRNRVK
jgi:hypothetical protein